MTQDEIIDMARAAGFILADNATDEAMGRFARFGALVAAAEREACAAIAADAFYGNAGELNHVIATAIRARGAA